MTPLSSWDFSSDKASCLNNNADAAALRLCSSSPMCRACAISGFKSGYHWYADDGFQRQNVNIISNAKPNLVAKFALNREGGSGGLSMSEGERRARVNMWPENLPGFKETLLSYHASIENLGRQFLPLWAASLKMPLDYFDKFFATPHVTRNLLYSPPQKEIGERQYGFAPHTDNAMMTFLAQKDVPGLAVRMLRLSPLLVAGREGLFAVPVEVPAHASPGDRLVGYLGRHPGHAA